MEANFDGARAPAGLLWLPAALLLGNCSREARAVRVPAFGAEVYSISCRTAVESCRVKAAELCGGDYQVLQSSGASSEPPRVSSAPGPRSTGSRYQRPNWTGVLVVSCGAVPRALGETSARPAPAPPPAAGLAPDQLCIPGETQLCLGPAACRGAQACLADGRGYGRCDCGPPAAADAGAG